MFLQVVRDLHGFAGREREFRAWVFTIAHHRLLDERRRQGRRPVEIASELPPEETGSDDAEESALQRLSTQRVRQVLEKLTPEQREVLLLRVFGDLTVDEVARLLGKSSGAIKALQRRGLEGVLLALAKDGVTP